MMDSSLLSTKHGVFFFCDHSADDRRGLGQSEVEDLDVASCLVHVLLKQLNSLCISLFFVYLRGLLLNLKTFFSKRKAPQENIVGEILCIIYVTLYRQAKDRLLL